MFYGLGFIVVIVGVWSDVLIMEGWVCLGYGGRVYYVRLVFVMLGFREEFEGIVVLGKCSGFLFGF